MHLLEHVQRARKRAHQNHTSSLSLAGKVANSIVRRHVPALRITTVPLDDRGTRIRADLTQPLGQSLCHYGFDAPEAGLVEALLGRGDAFVDGGAHVGLFTLIAAAAVGETGRVIACEPVPETLELLKQNLALNQFHWVETRNVALADGSGQQTFFSFGPGAALSSFAPATTVGSKRQIVEIRSLDEVTAALGSRVRLVKLDIEGAEARAVRGARALLQASPDFIVEVEADHLGRQGSTVEELKELFVSAGYQGYEIHGDRQAITLVRSTTWRPPTDNPNLFVSSRPVSAFPPRVHVNER